MIGKVQNFAFKGVYLKKDGKAMKNIKKAYKALEKSENRNEPFPRAGFDGKSFNATLRYGLEQLNDKKIDDGETRFLSVEPVYDMFTSLPAGYNLSIIDKDGNKFANGFSCTDKASVFALKSAFDRLKDNYKKSLSAHTANKYLEACSSVDSAVKPFVVPNGPDEA